MEEFALNLTTLGFTNFFEQQLTNVNTENKLVGRVILEHKHSYRVITEDGELLATISGNYAHNAYVREHYPAVGDFVIVSRMPGEDRGIIHHLFQRKSLFKRKVADRALEMQIVATNVDTVFLVMSLNDDFNIRRLERYLTAAWDSGAMPVIVLTKADLCDDPTNFLEQIESVAFGVDIVIVSAVEGEGLDAITPYVSEGKTVALLGSSGTGKSTLVNALSGNELMKTSGIREDDAKGRHTTTHRELVVTPSGGCIIDTPGMRELQLFDQEDSLSSTFEDIEQFATECRYRDCQHGKEPGCRIREAIQTGELPRERYASYLKLQKELAYLDRKEKVQARLLEKTIQKKISKKTKSR